MKRTGLIWLAIALLTVAVWYVFQREEELRADRDRALQAIQRVERLLDSAK